MWSIILISLLSGLFTPLGAVIALRLKVLSQVQLALFLGIAAGLMIAVVLTELMPISIHGGGRSSFMIGASIGLMLLFVLRLFISRVVMDKTAAWHQVPLLQAGFFIAISIALHDLPEGIAIGAGEAIHTHTGLIIAMAIAMHNIPEGMSIALPLRIAGTSTRTVLWLTILIGLITPIGTLISLGLWSFSHTFVNLSLAFAAGAMMYVVARDILPEALYANVRHALLGTGLGAIFMMAVSAVHTIYL